MTTWNQCGWQSGSRWRCFKPQVNSRILSTPTPTNSAIQSRPTPAPLEEELITIRPGGFDPVEIVRPKGNFLLAIDNRSGLTEVDLRLDSEFDNRLSKRVSREELDSRTIVDLNPGTYLLTEAGHPGWVCRFRIKSQ